MRTTTGGVPGAGDSPEVGVSGRLPIDEIGDLPLADLLAGGGCPLCRLRARAAVRYLESVLWESVTDPVLHDRLKAGRGLCRTHVRELLSTDRRQSGASLGAAILYTTVIRQRLGELTLAARSSARALRPMIANARRPVDCPVCAQVATAESAASLRLVNRATEPSWRSALEQAEFCLPDLTRLWAFAVERRADAWAPIADAQLRRIRGLAERLEGYAHHSSHDRRHLMTEPEQRASEEAALLLGGSPSSGTDR